MKYSEDVTYEITWGFIAFEKKEKKDAIAVLTLPLFPENLCDCDAFGTDVPYFSVTEDLQEKKKKKSIFFFMSFSGGSPSATTPWLCPG